MDHDHQPHEQSPSFWGSRYSIGLLVIGAVAGYFLLKEHLVHVANALPLLFVLACPLMHLFMHGGHGHGHGSHKDGSSSSSDPNKKGDAP